MRGASAILVRELRSQLVSPVAWSVAAGYLLLAGYLFFNLVREFAEVLRDTTMYAQVYQNPALLERVNLNVIVVSGLYANLAFLMLFIMPVLTMRSFAEERRQGTDELLLTAPVTPGAIVIGKFLGLAAVAMALVLGSGAFLAILLRYGDPETGPLWTGLLGLALVTLALASLGMAVSAATDSQVVAGVLSFVLFLLLFILDWPAATVGGPLGAALRSLALPARYQGFREGLVGSPDVLYFVSLIALGLFVARSIVASQRWR